MELNKNSKWIKFYLNYNDSYPSNSCEYRAGILKAIFITIFLFITSSLLLIFLVSPIALFWSKFDSKSILSGFQLLGLSFWLLFVILFIIYKTIVYYENKPYKYKPKKKSLIKQWYLDFKNKHCTLITWK